jgi:hypothetical protein
MRSHLLCQTGAACSLFHLPPPCYRQVAAAAACVDGPALTFGWPMIPARQGQVP